MISTQCLIDVIHPMSATDMIQTCQLIQPFQLLTSLAPCLPFLVTSLAHKSLLKSLPFSSFSLNKCLPHSLSFFFYTNLLSTFSNYFYGVNVYISTYIIYWSDILFSHLTQFSLSLNNLEIFMLFHILKFYFFIIVRFWTLHFISLIYQILY